MFVAQCLNVILGKKCSLVSLENKIEVKLEMDTQKSRSAFVFLKSIIYFVITFIIYHQVLITHAYLLRHCPIEMIEK